MFGINVSIDSITSIGMDDELVKTFNRACDYFGLAMEDQVKREITERGHVITGNLRASYGVATGDKNSINENVGKLHRVMGSAVGYAEAVEKRDPCVTRVFNRLAPKFPYYYKLASGGTAD